MTPEQHEEVLLLQVFDQFDVALNATGGAPIMWILAQAQKDCIEAMRQLMDIEPTNTDGIRTLQNEIARNRDLTRWMREAVIKGHELFTALSADERAFVGEFAHDSESSNQVEED